MELTVKRLTSDAESTLGELLVDGALECFTLEDEYRAQKVPGETRVPAGRYEVLFRTKGGKNADYRERYGSTWHKGMLELQAVPGFKFILIHVGNSHDDTAGCILVGRDHIIHEGHHFITGSRAAYERLYPKVRDALEQGDAVFIDIVGDEPAWLRAGGGAPTG